MIIGITGTDGSGKGTVVDYLAQHKGFTHYHGRKLFLEEIKKQGLPEDREHMRIVANDLRRIQGNDVVVRRFIDEAHRKGHKDIIIDSIRAVAEAETLKAEGGILLAVDADQQIRYERIRARNSESDNVTFEEFAAHEALEMNDPDPHGMQKQKVIEMADYCILNDKNLEALRSEVDAFLQGHKENH